MATNSLVVRVGRLVGDMGLQVVKWSTVDGLEDWVAQGSLRIRKMKVSGEVRSWNSCNML